MSARELVERRLAHDDAIHALAFLDSTPPLLCSGGIDETLKLWTITSASPTLTAPTTTLSAPSSLSCIALTPSPIRYPTSSTSPSPSLLWASFLDGHIRSLSPNSPSFVHSIPSSPTSTFTISHHPLLPLLATAGSTGALTLYKLPPSSTPLPTPATSAAEAKSIAATATTWPAPSFPPPTSSLFTHSLLFSPTGRYVVSGHHGGGVCVYETSSSKLLHSFSPHSAPVRSLCFSADEAVVYSGGDDGLICALSLTSMQQVGQWKAHTSYVTALLFHVVVGAAASSSAVGPAQRLVVSAGVEGKVKVWDVEASECLHTFDLQSPVWCLAKHPTEKWIAAGSENGTLRLLQLPA